MKAPTVINVKKKLGKQVKSREQHFKTLSKQKHWSGEVNEKAKRGTDKCGLTF